MNSDENPVGTQVSAIYKAGITLTAILLITFTLIFLTVLLQGNFSSILSNPLRWFSALDPSIAFEIVTTAAELLAAVLAIAITVVAIIVELAANRYSHRITSLFVREPINIIVMSFFVIATVFSVWIAITLDANVEGATVLNAGLFASLLMVTVSLVVLLPYFAFVMSFLSPVSVIGKIQASALHSMYRMDISSIASSKSKLLNAVDELQDIARRSSELSDRAVEMASINALLNIILDYQKSIAQIEENTQEWFDVEGVVENDPDFVSINETSLEHIQANKIWVEIKILRQYLDLISDSNPGSRDTSYLIAINTKRIAIESLNFRPKLELVFLCIRCFNSYLRATINNKDARTGYYIMNQYRMLAEELLEKGESKIVGTIAHYIQFYGLLGFTQGLPFLLEVAAEDVAQLKGDCIQRDEPLLDDLLNLLLELDQEVKKEYQEDSLLGVRRAQLKLAARLMDSGDEIHATRICDDLKSEKPGRLEQLFASLKSENRKEYWEFTDRGVNFGYLPENLKTHLDALARKTREQ